MTTLSVDFCCKLLYTFCLKYDWVKNNETLDSKYFEIGQSHSIILILGWDGTNVTLFCSQMLPGYVRSLSEIRKMYINIAFNFLLAYYMFVPSPLFVTHTNCTENKIILQKYNVYKLQNKEKQCSGYHFIGTVHWHCHIADTASSPYIIVYSSKDLSKFKTYESHHKVFENLPI